MSNDEHPGDLYIARYGRPSTESDIVHYTEFLRTESGIQSGPFLSFAPLYQRFKMDMPVLARLAPRSGFYDPLSHRIALSSDDPSSRRRYTEAHEWIEILFAAANSSAEHRHLSDQQQQGFCQVGAAHLLMDMPSYTAAVQASGVSMQTVVRLAAIYKVSLQAAAWRMIDVLGQHAIVVWEADNAAGGLKIKWAVPADRLVIPNGQMAAPGSMVYRAYEYGLSTDGANSLLVRGLTDAVRWENRPLGSQLKRIVLSLVFLSSKLEVS